VNTLYLCGAGNPEGVRLAKTVERAAGRGERLVLLDDDVSQHGRRILGVEVVGPFAVLAGASPQDSSVANLVARTTRKRSAARARIAAHALPFAALVDPHVDTDGVDLGPATTIYEHATVCPGSALGQDSVVFMNAVVGHGCRVGRGCVLAPGAVLNARVELAEGVYVGSNATLLPEVRVGAWATIGAGSVVLQDVPAGATVFGVPAQILVVADEGDRPARETPRLQTELEPAIAAVWCEVLGLAAVDPQMNFFDLGGTSLHAIQVCARLQERVYRALAITDLFRFPTVRSLAQHVSLGLGTDGPLSAPAQRGALRRQMRLARQQVGP